jgi:hypothetical protein
MLWPVAALAGLLLTFVIVYGSIVQARASARVHAMAGTKRDSGR